MPKLTPRKGPKTNVRPSGPHKQKKKPSGGDNWSRETSAAVAGQQDDEDDDFDVENAPVAEEIDDCLGPDSPGVSPNDFDFYD